jgi:hypothetical protein
MTDREDELAHLRGLRARHRKNIRTLEEMLANYGMDRPLPLLNNLEFEREQLRQVEERLAAVLASRQAGTEETPAAPAKPAAASPAVRVTVTGSGAAAVGEGATAAGDVAVGGDVHGDIMITDRSRADCSEENGA